VRDTLTQPKRRRTINGQTVVLRGAYATLTTSKLRALYHQEISRLRDLGRDREADAWERGGLVDFLRRRGAV
jgi:hypothetical protein